MLFLYRYLFRLASTQHWEVHVVFRMCILPLPRFKMTIIIPLQCYLASAFCKPQKEFWYVEYTLPASRFFSAEYQHCCIPPVHELRDQISLLKRQCLLVSYVCACRWICEGNSDGWGKLGPFGNVEIAVREALVFSLVVLPPSVFIWYFKYFIPLLVETAG